MSVAKQHAPNAGKGFLTTPQLMLAPHRREA